MNNTMQASPAQVRPPVADREASAQLLVSGSDIFALGHYPGNPIYPGVLILDRLCTLAETLAGREFGEAALVASVKRIQYLDAVLPGDVVELSASVKQSSPGTLEIATSARVGDKTKTRATLICNPGERRAVPAAAHAPVAGEKALSHRQLAQILPHRYPFLLLDAVEDYASGQWIRARKVINQASPLFMGQAPASYPQGLVIESFGQAGIALFFLSRESQAPVDIVLGSITDCSVGAGIPFGSVLTVEARIERMLSNGVVFSGEARIGDQLVTRIGSLVAMIDPR